MNAIDITRRRSPLAAAMPNFSVEIYPGDGLAAADWPGIAGPSDDAMYAFQAREFLDVWMSTIGKARGAEPYLVVVRSGGRPILFLPLVIEQVFNIRLLRFMDAGVVDYNAPILCSEHTLTQPEFAQLWSEIMALLPKVDAIDLQKMPGNIVGRHNPMTYFDCVPHGSSGHALSLGVLRGEVDARASVRLQRKNIQRRHEALNGLGRTDFAVNPTGVTTGYVLDRLLDLKRQKYLRTTGRDFLATPGVTRFYREMAAPGRIGRISHLSAVLCNDRVVSAHLGFIGRGRFHYLVPAYDTEYRRFEVGHMLLQHLIDQSFERGLATFDLGVGDFPYKARWATHHMALYNYERALTLNGWLYFQMRRTRQVIGATAIGKWAKSIRTP
jgi:CelD/BcsL family acetyltransferase involved in cellulose biosynthesis